MTAAAVENMEHKKARAEEANLPCRRFFSLKKLLKNLLTFHTLYSWRNRCYFFTVCSISY